MAAELDCPKGYGRITFAQKNKYETCPLSGAFNCEECKKEKKEKENPLDINLEKDV